MAGVRDALVPLAEEPHVAVAVTVTVVAGPTACVLEDALALFVAALEALAAGMIIGSTVPVEAPIPRGPLPAALYPAAFVFNRRISRAPTDAQTDQPDGQALQCAAPARRIAEIACQSVKFPTVHLPISFGTSLRKTGKCSPLKKLSLIPGGFASSSKVGASARRFLQTSESTLDSELALAIGVRMLVDTGQGTSRAWPLYPSRPGVSVDDPRGLAKRSMDDEDIGVMVDSNREQGSAMTLHLVPEDVWLAQKDASHYLPDGFASEGFIHCTHGDDVVIEVGNRYYRDDPRAYLLLEVELERVAAPVVYEDDERRYPHIYGPIERHAVRRVCRIERAADGTFIAIGEPAPEHL